MSRPDDQGVDPDLGFDPDWLASVDYYEIAFLAAWEPPQLADSEDDPEKIGVDT